MAIYITYEKDQNGDCEAISWSQVQPADDIKSICLHIDNELTEMSFGEDEADWALNFSRKFQIDSIEEAQGIIDNNGLLDEVVIERYVSGPMCTNTMLDIFTWYGQMQVDLADEYLDEYYA